MYCPPTETRTVSNAPMLILAMVSNCFMVLVQWLKSTAWIAGLVPKPNRFTDWHNPTGILVRISSAILYNSEGNRKRVGRHRSWFPSLTVTVSSSIQTKESPTSKTSDSGIGLGFGPPQSAPESRNGNPSNPNKS